MTDEAEEVADALDRPCQATFKDMWRMTMLVMDTPSLASKLDLELKGPNETIWNIMT